jgi:signal transduction histidine kinase
VSRRILLMLLAFTAIVLVGAVVPLTLNATSHDRTSFIQAAAGMARTDAVAAQARLDELAEPPRNRGSALAVAEATASVFTVAKQARQNGDGLLVLTSSGQPVVRSGTGHGDWKLVSQQAETDGQTAILADQAVQPVTQTVGSQVIAAMPVFIQGNQRWIGTVILVRSAKPLDHEILELWVILGSIAAAAMLAAAVLAFGLARWVSRPLKGLDAAARRLADGDLAIRAKVQSGPPELRRLGTTFNTMAGRLEALVHGNRAVIADVSHQLRTPLAALRLRLDLLAADAAHTDPDTGRELAEALDELARLSRLVDGLLAVARAENAVPVPTKVDVDQVARERVSAWHPVADDRCIVLVISPAPPVLAWIGEGHLEQILDNLIANALDALSPGNLVRLTVAATPTGARITVADNGPGMSAEDRERAFLRWFTNSSSNGTGLGLAIVHRLVTSNGGTARLDQTPGGGLTVTLNFPGVPTPNGGAGGAGSAGSASGASGAGGAPAHGAGVQDIVSL